MNRRTRYSTIGATFVSLMGLSLSLQARTALTPAQEAPEMLRNMKLEAVTASDQAFRLDDFATHNQLSPETYAYMLRQLKQEVNAMGREVVSLDAERSSLEPWEQQALDKVIPLLEETASQTESATVYFNEHRNYLWNPEYRAKAEKISNDTHEIAQTLARYLKLEQAEEKERHLQAAVDTGSN